MSEREDGRWAIFRPAGSPPQTLSKAASDADAAAAPERFSAQLELAAAVTEVSLACPANLESASCSENPAHAKAPMSSCEEALRCISQLEAKVGTWTRAGCAVSLDELPAVKAALVRLKGYIQHSRQSEALLRDRISSLERDLNTVRADLSAATDVVADLERRLVAVESRDRPITVREAMRELEKRICLEAAGSATAAKRLYNFSRFEKGSVAEQARLASVAARHGLSEDCLLALGYMKDLGDAAAHDARPSLPVSEWEGLLAAALRSSPFDGDASIPAALLAALKSYVPPPADPSAAWVVLQPA